MSLDLRYLKKQATISVKSYLQSLIREGRRFKKLKGELRRLNNQGELQRKEYQLTKLREIACYAQNNIPYWKRIFEEYDFQPEKLQDVSELKVLPLLNKKIVQADLQSFLPISFGKRFYSTKGYTSGTTGTPGIFYRDYSSINFENAMIHSVRERINVKSKSRLLILRGSNLVPASQKKPPFWINDYGNNSFLLSSYHLNEQYKEQIIDEVEKQKIDCAFAYPSSVYLLASWCKKLNRSLPFKKLHTSSETVLDYQREIIRDTLIGDWLDHYGQAERVNFFASYNSKSFLEYSEYGVSEYLKSSEYGYEVIGSTLHNYLMPLFRYQTGDVVERVKQVGDSRPQVTGLLGRVEDFVHLPDGTMVGRLDLIFKGLEHIEECQIIQENKQELKFCLVKMEEFSDCDERKLISNIRSYLGNEFKLSIVFVDSLQRTKNGKFKFVVNKIDQ